MIQKKKRQLFYMILKIDYEPKNKVLYGQIIRQHGVDE